MKSNFKVFITVLFVAASTGSMGTADCYGQPQFRFKHITVEDGLSQSTVRVIYQDRMGFMWFGTDIGINKYDGSNITVYKHNTLDTAGLPSNFIVEILEDSAGILWIGTGIHGLVKFDREHETFYTYQYEAGNPQTIGGNSIRALFEDSQYNLWIGTSGGGLSLFNRHNNTFTRYRHEPGNDTDIGSNYISGIAQDSRGFLWLSSPEGILTRFDPRNNKGYQIKLFPDKVTDLGTTTFGNIYVDSEDNIWLASEVGLFFYDQKTESVRHFVKGKTNRDLNEDAVSDVHELSPGIFLIATDHGGLNVYNRHTGTFTYYKHNQYDEASISNDQLYTIFESDDGIIWIGNYHGGVNILDLKAKKFLDYSDLLEDPLRESLFGSVLTIEDDADGNIWFGYDGEGIRVYNPKTRRIRQMLATEGASNTIPGNNVTEIYRDSKGNMWIGTYLRGMGMMDRETGKFHHYRFNPKDTFGIGGNNVWAILEDSKGNFWVGFQGNGLDRFDPRTGIFTHFRHNPDDLSTLSNNDIYHLFEDSRGHIYISTRNGLCRYSYEKNGFERFMSGTDLEKGIIGNRVYDIYEDAEGNLWVGTDQALNKLNVVTGIFTHWRETDGVEGNAILSVMRDNHKYLWLSTNKGLSRFDLVTEEFRNYDVADGLPCNEFNYISDFRDADGRFYFGGKTGIAAFHPDSVQDNPRIPPVYFTGLEVLNTPVNARQFPEILSRHINYEKQVTLSHKQTVITFRFAALNYSTPRKNQYAYQLEGFDKEWNYIGNKNEITYTNLNPGKYILRVKASNNDGVWNETGATLVLNVLPPWYKTLLFRITLYLLIIGLIIMGYYLRVAFFKSQQHKLMELVKERTLQLEEVAVKLEEKQEEINSQNEELMSQRDELESNNHMLIEQKQQITEQHEELEKHRNQLESLVEERTRELVLAKEKAEESDRLKSSFLANLSHEIRTPLNAILGFSSLLGEKDITDEERTEYNRIVQGSSGTLLELINDILDISKIEAGQLELDLHEVSLDALLSDQVVAFDMLLKRDDIGLNKDIAFKLAMDDSIRDTTIVTDSVRLNQVLSNLINNAVKFTREGYIEVGCRKRPDAEMLEFYVKDTGIGIREENQQMVFERFRKVEEDKDRLHRGTGLGLAISNQLVNLLGGSMRLTSKVGEGSVFYFTVPFIKSDADVLRHVARKKNCDTVDLSGVKIIVAEDDTANFSYIDKLLRKTKAIVHHAETGRQVLEILQREKDIRLILMDIKMPEMDGIEALHALRDMNFTLPVIAQTAYALADEVIKLKREGFDEYISKPIQQELLYAMLAAYFK